MRHEAFAFRNEMDDVVAQQVGLNRGYPVALNGCYLFKRLEYRLSGHLRAGPAVAAAPAEEALAVR